MNLKNYQRETLDVLRRYFEATQFKTLGGSPIFEARKSPRP